MSCPKESIEVRRDLLNLIDRSPTMPAHKMRLINSPEHTRRIINHFEAIGLITQEPHRQTFKRTLTDKGKRYQNALNEFSKFIDIF